VATLSCEPTWQAGFKCYINRTNLVIRALPRKCHSGLIFAALAKSPYLSVIAFENGIPQNVVLSSTACSGLSPSNLCQYRGQNWPQESPFGNEKIEKWKNWKQVKIWIETNIIINKKIIRREEINNTKKNFY